jgi:hypothetical protein
MKALKDLGLNVVRGVVTTEGPNLRKKRFLVTRMYTLYSILVVLNHAGLCPSLLATLSWNLS